MPSVEAPIHSSSVKPSFLLPRLFLILAVFAGISANVFAADDEESGLWIERKNGSFLKLDICENRLRVHFFDADKKPVEADAVRTIAHYNPRNLTSRQTVLFYPVEGEKHLEAKRFIHPPFHFQVVVVLVFDENGERSESYSGRISPKHVAEE